MEVLYEKCAGLDVHKDSVVACVRAGAGSGTRREQRRFGTTTSALMELSEWLSSHGCTHVVMEATGVYWRPVWHVLDGQFELVLANARHVRNVPGRKTDITDATWLADLLAHGLVRASFVPDAPTQQLRDLTPHPQTAHARGRPAHPADPEGPRRRQHQADQRAVRYAQPERSSHPGRCCRRRVQPTRARGPGESPVQSGARGDRPSASRQGHRAPPLPTEASPRAGGRSRGRHCVHRARSRALAPLNWRRRDGAADDDSGD